MRLATRTNYNLAIKQGTTKTMDFVRAIPQLSNGGISGCRRKKTGYEFRNNPMDSRTTGNRAKINCGFPQ
jgi:hypothetical protein